MDMELPRTEPVELRKIRTVPEILNATSEFIRQHFRPLSRLILRRAFPPLLFAGMIGAYLFSSGILDSIFMWGRAYGNPTWQYGGGSSTGSIVLQALLALLLFVIGYTLLIGLVHTYARHARESHDGSVNADEVWKDTKEDFWRVFWTNLGLGVIYNIVSVIVTMFTGLFIFIHPTVGMLFQWFGLLAITTNFSLYYAARFVSNEGFGGSFSRSLSLVSGSWWRTMGLIVLCGLLLVIMVMVTLVPVWIVLQLVQNHLYIYDPVWLQNNGELMKIITTASLTLFFSAVQLYLVFPLFSLILHYFNLIERREATTIMEEIENIGVANVEA